MAIIGINIDKKNPDFSQDDFLFWIPQFKEVIENKSISESDFNKLKEIANNKIFKSIYGSDWELAMSLCIAHYIELRAANLRIPQSSDIRRLGGGSNYKGILNSYSVGSFSKSIDTQNTLVTDVEANFWNQTSYGAQLMALLKSKPVASIFVITEN